MRRQPNSHEAWAAEILRVGNRAVKRAQDRNRELGIANWYSVHGRLVSDTGEIKLLEDQSIADGEKP